MKLNFVIRVVYGEHGLSLEDEGGREVLSCRCFPNNSGAWQAMNAVKKSSVNFNNFRVFKNAGAINVLHRFQLFDITGNMIGFSKVYNTQKEVGDAISLIQRHAKNAGLLIK